MIAGGYTASRRFESSFVSLLYLFSETKVLDNHDGTISVSTVTSPSNVPRKWREIAPFVWRDEGGKDLLSGRVEGGRVTRFSFGEVSPFEMYDRTVWWKSPAWLLPLLIAGLIALSLNSLAWPVSALTRRHYGVSYGLSGREATSHRLVRIACVTAAVVFLCWLTLIFTMISALDLSSKLGGWIGLLRILSPLVFLGGAAIGLWSAWVVLRSQRRWFAKLWAVVLGASFLVTLWAAVAFHLISFHSGY